MTETRSVGGGCLQGDRTGGLGRREYFDDVDTHGDDHRAAHHDLVESMLDRIDPAEVPAIDPPELRHIAELVADRARLDHDLRDAVRAAHDSGRPWAQIGVALGVSRRAARRLYADPDPEVG
jgi:hypothetical protein